MSDNKAPVSQEKLSPVSAEKSVLTPIGSPEAENKSNVILAPASGDETITEAGVAALAKSDVNADVKAEEKPASLFKKRFSLWGKTQDQEELVKLHEAASVDPRTDIVAWISQQIPGAVHKLNYHVLLWVQQTLTADDEIVLPGKDGQVTRNQFLSFLRDGALLVKLANKLQPGALDVDAIEEGTSPAKEKEAQIQSLEKFAIWAHHALDLDGGNCMAAADLLEKGKAGYPAVFETLWNLGVCAEPKFGKAGLDVDAVVADANSAVQTTIVDTLTSFFKRPSRSVVEAPAEEKTEEKIEDKSKALPAEKQAALFVVVDKKIEKAEYTLSPTAEATDGHAPAVDAGAQNGGGEKPVAKADNKAEAKADGLH